MVEKQFIIPGMAYVPGVAQGVLGLAQGAEDTIAVISGDQLARPTGTPAGIIVVAGAPFSHAMIRLLGTGVPTVIITQQQAQGLTPGARVQVDGTRGVVSNPLADHESAPPPMLTGQPVKMGGGVQVELRASVRSIAAAQRAVTFGASAIGLVRSEFFIPEDGRTPDEAYYQQQFHELSEVAGSMPITFRLLDISADKIPSWLTASEAMESLLGMQGVRLFGESIVTRVVQAQLRVLAQLHPHTDVRVLIPYLTRYEELELWGRWVRDQLPDTVGVGAMVETPAGALDIGHWFDHADFIALGCNDLMQTLFAADRDRPELAAYLDPYAPLLYRFLRKTAEECGPHLQNVQLCGVLPQLAAVLPVLVGLGYRNFSVEAQQIPYLAESLRPFTRSSATRLAAAVCESRESREVLDILGLPNENARPFAAGEP